MKKDILNLKGVKVLNKKEQSVLNGGQLPWYCCVVTTFPTFCPSGFCG